MKILPRRYILRGKNAVRRTIGARPVRTANLAVHYVESERTRAAFLVPKRLGKAVVRNLCKRRMRETYRYMRDDFPKGEIIFRAMKLSGWDEMREDFRSASRKMARLCG